MSYQNPLYPCKTSGFKILAGGGVGGFREGVQIGIKWGGRKRNSWCLFSPELSLEVEKQTPSFALNCQCSLCFSPEKEALPPRTATAPSVCLQSLLLLASGCSAKMARKP